MDWNDCVSSKLIKQIKPDFSTASALKIQSSQKLSTVQLIPLTLETCSSIISLRYEALRESLEALALEKGFKIYNHECYRCFLQKVMNQDLLAHTFDRLRRIRNNANYYAKQYNVVETKIFLGDCESFTNFLIK